MKKIKYRKHKTIRSLLRQYYNFEKTPDFSLKDIGEIGGIDEDGNEYVLTIEDEINSHRRAGYWGFADSNTDTIYYWMIDSVDEEELFYFLAHEIGHLTGEQLEDIVAEEERADDVAGAALETFKKFKSLRRENRSPGESIPPLSGEKFPASKAAG